MSLAVDYAATGYLVVDDCLSATEVADARTMADDTIARLPGDMRMEDIVFPHVDDALWTETSRIDPSWGRASTDHAAFFEICRHPRVLDVVEQLLGPDIVLFSSHLIAKAPGDGYPAPWHQDAFYWPLEPHDETLTVWLAIDDSTTENGCMQVVPGSHRNGILEHQQAPGRGGKLVSYEVDIGQLDNAPVDIELRAGSFSVHQALTVHGSALNTSAKRRCGYTIAYMSARTKLTNWDGMPIYLMRGKPAAGVSYCAAPPK